MSSLNGDRAISDWQSKVAAVFGFDAQRVPPLVVAFLIAEFFFKFGSFTLECLAFLALWRVLDIAVNLLINKDN